MKTFRLLSNISICGIFILTIEIFFFKKYFAQSVNLVLLYTLIALLIIFPIAELLKKRTIKKNERKYH